MIREILNEYITRKFKFIKKTKIYLNQENKNTEQKIQIVFGNWICWIRNQYITKMLHT